MPIKVLLLALVVLALVEQVDGTCVLRSCKEVAGWLVAHQVFDITFVPIVAGIADIVPASVAGIADRVLAFVATSLMLDPWMVCALQMGGMMV
mmetsp:Transcript_13540/g.19827  ORF Transcript_13540/g.19827 Transcript_13540/m.19827 type:complete len:93 (-) Transcript_13540:1009-1287(-)